MKGAESENNKRCSTSQMDPLKYDSKECLFKEQDCFDKDLVPF